MNSPSAKLDVHGEPGEGRVASVELVRVSHRFGTVLVLRNVDLEIYGGECLGLIGQNGAGKSTLINIVTGKLQPSEGEVRVRGQAVRMRNPRVASRLGIAVVAQELELFPTLSVAENVVFGNETIAGSLVDRRQAARAAREAFARLGVDIDPRKPVEELSVGDRQLTEIARALVSDRSVVILDEPTSALSPEESKRLLVVMRELKEHGVGLVFVSHKLNEVLEVCDQLCILRDGQVVGAGTPVALGGYDGIVERLVGERVVGSRGVSADLGQLERQVVQREVGLLEGRGGGPGSPGRGRRPDSAIRVRNLQVGRTRVEELEVGFGEVVGFAGVEGSGSGEVLEALAGIHRYEAEELAIRGKRVTMRGPWVAPRLGVLYLSPDRKTEGIFAELSVSENVGLGRDTPSRGLLHPVRWLQDCGLFKELRELLSITASGPLQETRSLSGGNQQKVLFGRAIAGEGSVWLLSEPTRGIDIKARVDIYELIRRRAAEGLGIVVRSIDTAEIIAVCDRCYVFADGQVVKELSGENLTEEAIYAALV